MLPSPSGYPAGEVLPLFVRVGSGGGGEWMPRVKFIRGSSHRLMGCTHLTIDSADC